MTSYTNADKTPEDELPLFPKKTPKPRPGDVSKRDGMDRVEDNTRLEWRRSVLAALRVVAGRLELFTMEDVRRECDARKIDPPHHVNAWGPIAATAAAQGICVATGRYVTGSRGESHAHSMREWRSLVFKPTP